MMNLLALFKRFPLLFLFDCFFLCFVILFPVSAVFNCIHTILAIQTIKENRKIGIQKEKCCLTSYASLALGTNKGFLLICEKNIV